MSEIDLPEYDRTEVPGVGNHAIVVGAGMAGLLAARVLADGFEAVTVLDRDPLPDDPEPRDGIPHAPHTHGIKEAGRYVFEELVPGYTEDLVAEGAVLGELGADVRVYARGDFLASGSEFPEALTASRLLFECLLRRRVASLDPVQLRPNCQVRTYLTDETGTAVEGVEVRNGDADSEELAADLVVDATGRASRTPIWLEQHDYPTPRVEEVGIDVAYSSVFLERPSDDRRSFLVHAGEPRTRSGQVVPIEDERWLVSLIGVGGDHPPTDVEGFREFASSLPTSAVVDCLDEHSWVTEEVHHYPFPTSRRYRYEELDRFPPGLIVVGDAFCCTDPVYGLGMSSAVFQAMSLHLALAEGDLEGMEHRFFEDAARGVDPIWNTTANAAKKYAHTDGEYSRVEKLAQWYVKRLQRRAHTDSELSKVCCNLSSLKPVNIFQPRIMWRVLRPTLLR